VKAAKRADGGVDLSAHPRPASIDPAANRLGGAARPSPSSPFMVNFAEFSLE
jgi:hypothetical protein